jgi:hypothetical protein
VAPPPGQPRGPSRPRIAVPGDQLCFTRQHGCNNGLQHFGRVLQVSVHHGDHFTPGYLKTSADGPSQASGASTASTVHEADRRVGKHCLPDRIRGPVVGIIDEDQLPIEPTRPESHSQARDQNRDIGRLTPGRYDNGQGAATVSLLAAGRLRKGDGCLSVRLSAPRLDGHRW